MTLTSKVLIVGEQPTERYRFANQPALGGRCARRLVELMDLKDEAHLRELFDVENLFPSAPADWSSGVPQSRAWSLAHSSQADFLVLCGPRVQAAFQVQGNCEIVPVPMLTRPTIAACIPHPHGRSKSWKNPEVVKRATEVLMEARRYIETGQRWYCYHHAKEMVLVPDEHELGGIRDVYECGCEVIR